MALFAQYAYAAAQEAVKDAGVEDMSDAERENVVSDSPYKTHLLHGSNIIRE
jgi:3-oxoacyl-(acyl-carrier-protein) synthase